MLCASIPAENIRQYSYVDADILSGQSYRYTLFANEKDGTEWQLGWRDLTTGAPSILSLEQNVPNPFNPVTQITVGIPEPVDVDLSIVDVNGRLVARLVSGRETAGTKLYTWDGKDARGNPVSSGVYFYRLTAGDKTLTKKMVMIR
jgi:hypothetical protein